MNSAENNSIRKKILATLAAAIAIVLALLINSITINNQQRRTPPPSNPVLPQVSITEVRPASYQAEVLGHGQVNPVYSLTLSAEVSGKVMDIASDLFSGTQVKKNDLLLTIEDASYRQTLASAQADLSTAELALLQEELNRKQAQQEWQRSGLSGQPDSILVLRGPQLKVAQDAVDYAKATLEKAQRDLNKTRIKAPFDALVVSRSAQPGSYLQIGGSIAELYGTQAFELSIPLSSRQWANLPSIAEMQTQQWPVTLTTNNDQNQSWQGIVSRAEQHLDSSSQRALIIRINEPLKGNNPLYAGTYVTARIPGKTVDNTWQIPASAITQDNSVWYLNKDNALTKASVELHFTRADQAYISPLTDDENTSVVSRPLSSYLPGMKVNGKTENTMTEKPDSGVENKGAMQP